jgi:hypothetical protein
MSICFMREDAVEIYDKVRSRGTEASEPQVGNALWVTGLTDADGYGLFIEGPQTFPKRRSFQK